MKKRDLIKLIAKHNVDAEVEISSLIRSSELGYKQHVIKSSRKKRGKKKGRR